MPINNNWKFQIECNNLKNNQTCLACDRQFQLSDARLIVCNDTGEFFGDVCPECTTRGGNWINSQLNRSTIYA
ncbi:MAG: hypothetical protein ACRC2R_23700 [Xenococcaceae cyanobacterium]